MENKGFIMMKKNLLLLFMLFACVAGNAQVAKTVNVKKPGTLAELLTDDEKTSVIELTISGKLNSRDIAVLRRMAGAEEIESEFTWTGKLESLDIREASFVNDKTPFLKTKAKKDFTISFNRKYKVYTKNRKTGESRVMSRDEYMERLEDYRNSSSGNMLKAHSAGSRVNRIEALSEGKTKYVLSEITNAEWSEIKRNGRNEWVDHYVDRQKGDSVFYLYYHAAKKIISSSMFRHCKNLKNVLLSPDIEGIGSMAFQGCTSLEEITIPQKVENVAASAFRMTPALKKVSISKKSGVKLFTLDDTVIIDRFFKTSNPEIVIERY